MTIFAIAGSGLFQWEQSAETIDMPPIIPALLFLTSILSILSLLLSMIAMEVIKKLQEKPPKHIEYGKRIPTMPNAMLENEKCHRAVVQADSKNEKRPAYNGKSLSDMEKCDDPCDKCRCTRHMSETHHLSVRLFQPSSYFVMMCEMTWLIPSYIGRFSSPRFLLQYRSYY